MENKKLIHKTRMKLTLLCAGITIAILWTISFLSLHIFAKTLYQNQVLTFENTIQTLYHTLNEQTVITRSWLETAEQNGGFFIQIKDNGNDYLYNKRTQDTPLGEVFLSAYEELAVQTGDSFFLSLGKERYLVSHQKMPRENGMLEIMAVYPLKHFQAQLKGQERTLLLLVLAASLLLFFFAFYFTGKLLMPILENQKNQNRFIAAASHELRTPLSVILSCAGACRKAPAGQKEDFLNTIEGESLRMSRMLTDMLTLVKADYLSCHVQKEPCDPDALLLNAYDAFQTLAFQKGLSLRVELPREIAPACHADGQRITQVLAILLQNAISYTPAGGTICLSRTAAPDKIIYRVADNGAGISEEEKKHIFEPFYRSRTAKSDDSHFGLGLSIAREIVAAHQGRISVTDTPGGGSTFVVEFPSIQ